MRSPRRRSLPEKTSRDTVGDEYLQNEILLLPVIGNVIVVHKRLITLNRTREVFSFVYGREIEVSVAAKRRYTGARVSERKSILGRSELHSQVYCLARIPRYWCV